MGKGQAAARAKKARAQLQTAKDSREYEEQLKKDLVKARQKYALKAWKANVENVHAALSENKGKTLSRMGGHAAADRGSKAWRRSTEEGEKKLLLARLRAQRAANEKMKTLSTYRVKAESEKTGKMEAASKARTAELIATEDKAQAEAQ